MENMVVFVRNYFPAFMLGAIFGKLIETSGFAKSIVNSFIHLLGPSRAMLAIVVVCVLLTYGGVSLFVVVFSVYPFAAEMFRALNIPKRLIQEGQAVGSSRFVYALGKMVLWSPQPGFVDVRGAVLNKGNFTKLAIADPKFSPYGLAAKETLEKLVMWNAMQEKLIKGENVTQTYQLAASENADLAFISL